MTSRSVAVGAVGGLLLAGLALVVPGPASAAPAAPVPAAPVPAAPGETCAGLPATIVGTGSRDRLVGTPGRDVIAALGGDDLVMGLGGDDVICGGPGSDRLDGGTGDDRLLGGLDAYIEDKYGPYLEGDDLTPGPGRDRVVGGYDRRQARIGAHPDTVHYEHAAGPVVVVLAGPGGTGTARGEGTDQITGEARTGVGGSRYDDRLVGTAGDDTLRGHGGDDVLLGRGGDDSLGDGDPSDHASDTGTDLIRGGPGDDSILSERGPDRVAAGAGDDDVAATVACPDLDGGSGANGVSLDSLDLVAGQDSIEVDARTGQVVPAPGRPACGHLSGFSDWTLYGDARATFSGTDGPERLSSYGGQLTAYLLGGDDEVVGSAFDDLIDAGAGDDTVDGSTGRDACLAAEHVQGCEGDTYPLPPPSCDGRLATIVADEPYAQLVGTPGDDVILGSEGRDTIDGLGGDDVICGSDGADLITGGPGNDRIFAGLDSYDQVDPGSYSLSGDRVAPGPGDDYVDLGFDDRHLDLSLNNNSAALDELDYSHSAAGIVADLSVVGSLGTVIGEGTDTIVVQAQTAITGSRYADTITGSPGIEWITSLGGDDVIDGAAGDDQLFGDTPFCCGQGPPDHDVLIGGPGDDELGSTLGRDELDGGDGDDELWTRSPIGALSMVGGAGDDSLEADARPAWPFAVDGGPGSDTLGLSGSHALPHGSRLIVDVPGGEVRSSAATLTATMTGFETYLLDAADLRLVFLGSDLGEEVRVNRGASLRATMGDGDDIVEATPGDDVVDGGPGNDRVWGLDGTDTCLDVEHTRSCEVVR